MKTQHYLKIAVILLAFLQPLLILIFLGNIDSISLSWGTILQPVFILTNASTSFYFFHSKGWKISAILLMFLTAFSTDIFEIIHNILSLGFFISCFVALNRDKYSRYIYLLCVPVYFLYNIFWAEFVAISVLCYYHLNILIKINKYYN